MVAFKGVDFTIEKSDLSGGDWVKYSNTPKEYQLGFFDKVRCVDSAEIPYAYLVPQEWNEIIELVKLHGITIKRLTEPATLVVQSYRFSNVTWRDEPYEGRHLVSFDQETITEERTFPKGTAVIKMNQRTNRVIAHLLEPKGPDSFVTWGFFNGIFKRTEYTEYYVMEEMAREMLKKDSDLKKEFEEKLASDTAFANSPRKRLYFFYKRTPYYDQHYNVYPVGKVMEGVTLPVQ
jgi:hypothetical protein